jgi:hypothetical protein
MTASPIFHPALDEAAACGALPTAAREELAAARLRSTVVTGDGAGPGCAHRLGGLPCVNQAPHAGRGRGCVHHSESGAGPARLRRRRVRGTCPQV